MLFHSRLPLRLAGVSLLLSLPYAPTFAQPDMPPAPVNVASVVEGSFAQPIRLTGDVQPYELTYLAVENDGIVEEILADEGDHVTSGTALMRLRTFPLEIEYRQATAAAKRDAERLLELQRGTRPEDIAIAKANWDEAKVNAEISKREFERYESLLADNSISQSEYDVIKSRWETARAMESIMKARYDLALEGPREEVIAAAEAEAAASAARAEMARDQLDRATIRAPYDGVITRRYVSPGSWVSEGDNVFTIQQLDRVKVAIQVPEGQFRNIRLGDTFKVTFDSLDGYTTDGTITQIIPSAEPRSRAFPVRVTIENGDGRLASGMLARVSLNVQEEGEKSVLVPRDAIVPMHPKPLVYKIERRDGETFAAMVEVDLGRFFGDAVEVFGDLRGGDQVVIRGNERLRPGQKVVLDTFVTQRAPMDEIDPSRFFDEDREIVSGKQE